MKCIMSGFKLVSRIVIVGIKGIHAIVTVVIGNQVAVYLQIVTVIEQESVKQPIGRARLGIGNLVSSYSLMSVVIAIPSVPISTRRIRINQVILEQVDRTI